MARDPRDRLTHEQELVEDAIEDGAIDDATGDRLLEFSKALDPSLTRHKYFIDGEAQTYALRSIERYLQSLRLCGERGLTLCDCTAAEFNDFVDRQHDERGLAKTTLSTGYQAGARHFFRYHDDLGVDPDDIHKFSVTSEPRHDERDMFTEDEVDALRDACEQPRDRAFLEMFIYTGQRLTAIRTLRVRDVDVDDGVFYLNDEREWYENGLKGADDRGRKRPLFGARKYVRDWLQYHPNGDDPDAPLFIGDPGHWKTKVDEPWSEPGARKHMKRIAERAGVDKPVNPHNFRHYFVTVMKRDYDMDEDTLRALMGVVEDSDVLQTVYGHVTNADYVRKAERQVGYREDEESASSFTPETCPTCGEILEDHWRRCPACGELFAPELQELDEQAEAVRSETMDTATDPDAELTADEREAVRMILRAVDDPLDLVDSVS